MAPPDFSTVGFEDYNINGAQGMLSNIHLRHFVRMFSKVGDPLFRGFVSQGKFGNSWTVSTGPCFGHNEMGIYLLVIF